MKNKPASVGSGDYQQVDSNRTYAGFGVTYSKIIVDTANASYRRLPPRLPARWPRCGAQPPGWPVRGDGVFSGTQDVPAAGASYAVTLGDADGDGDLDLLTAGSTDVSVLRGSEQVLRLVVE